MACLPVRPLGLHCTDKFLGPELDAVAGAVATAVAAAVVSAITGSVSCRADSFSVIIFIVAERLATSRVENFKRLCERL